MAIPWLIGGLVLVAGKALIKKLNEDDNSSSSNDTGGESRRREEAERERTDNERNKKLNIAHENFAILGESIGLDIAQSLQGWIKVEFVKSPAFSANLDSKDSSGMWFSNLEVSTSKNEGSINAIIPSSTPQFEKIRKNLKVYSGAYNVKMKQGEKLTEAGREIEMIETELEQISKIKAEISKLQSDLSAKI